MSHPVEQLKLLLVQYPVCWESNRDNLLFIEQIIPSSLGEPHIVLLPESFNNGFSMEVDKIAEPMNGETVSWMKEIASEHNFAIAGSLFVREGPHFYNRFVFVEPDGKLSWYDKRHLFRISGESETLSHGNKRVVFDYLGWKIFPQICYDLRFPVWSRNNLDYDLLINVANWPAARHYAWESLLRARAIENLCYVAGINRTGTDGNKVDHNGFSMVLGPKGETKCILEKDAELMEVSLFHDELQSFRKKFSVLNDRDSFMIAY